MGYDNNLNRLGYGGGFYDRYFEKNSKFKKIIKIGLAFSFQKIKKLPVNKFDKKLDGIITEKELDMRILFLGDVVGQTGCYAIKQNLQKIIKENNIDFTIVNGENAANEGVGITQNIVEEFLSCGVDVVTSGNHIWDQKETFEVIKNQTRLLRPLNMDKNLPGHGFSILNSRQGLKIGVLNLMGNVFMKKCDDLFITLKKFLENKSLKKTMTV